MEKISPTRMNLLVQKNQMRIAEEGLELLRSKREALVREFFQVMEKVVTARDRLDELMREAMASLTLALGLQGRESVSSTAIATRRDIPADIIERNIWGTKFSEVQYRSVRRTLDARGYGIIGVSTSIDEAATGFEKVLDFILKMVSEENRLKRLGDEIKKVNRRINALNERILPELKGQVKYIRSALEEREREDIFRLKRLKGRR